ncbi:ParA family protein [Methylobacterium nigriterrae]|uniref:ParA family protein n=1 Tax=Methylobacterium nigriterrae TaxID=3127512 RepID=UPI003013BC66
MTVAARKGGAGKSTLSILLASMFAHTGLRALLIDTDAGQHTAQAWAAHRPSEWPVVVTLGDTRELDLIVSRARERMVQFCIIDTPAGLTEVGEAATALADVVVVPTRCGATDRWAVRSTVDDVRASGKPFLVVPTAAPALRRGREADDVRLLREELSDIAGAVWEGQLTERRGISYDLAAGRVPSETNWAGPTNTECLELWRRIMGALSRQASALPRSRQSFLTSPIFRSLANQAA